MDGKEVARTASCCGHSVDTDPHGFKGDEGCSFRSVAASIRILIGTLASPFVQSPAQPEEPVHSGRGRPGVVFD